MIVGPSLERISIKADLSSSRVSAQQTKSDDQLHPERESLSTTDHSTLP